MAGRKELKKVANGLAKHFNFKVEEQNKNAISLWDQFEVMISVVNVKGDIGLSFNLGIEKLDIASIAIVATRLYPDIGLATPFYFDYRYNKLYSGDKAIAKAKEAEFYFNLQSLAHGNDLGGEDETWN